MGDKSSTGSENVKPYEVARSYDQIAQRWNDDSFARDNGIEQHNRAMAFVKNYGYALNIGCGCSGRFADLLIERGFEVECVDISEKMIELARLRHPQITFYHADICEWELPRQYDFITAWDSIWHIPLSAHQRVLGKILSSLTPGGVCIFTTGGVDRPSETYDSAMGVPMYHSAPGIPALLEMLADLRCVCRHLEYDQYPESHVYIIAQKMGG